MATFSLRRVFLLAPALALLLPLLAAAAPAALAAKRPVVRSVTPLSVGIGEKLTLRGSGFVRGRNKNTVIFRRQGGKLVFVKAELATAKLLRVTLPAKLRDALAVRSGARVPTRLRVRVLARRLGASYTRTSRSPVVGPEDATLTPETSRSSPTGDCDGDKRLNREESDDDADGLSDDTEIALRLQPCEVDSDGDEASDGFEYASARELNDDEDQEGNTYLPFPGKRPYPNPLDGSDKDTDFDGDGLSVSEEFRLAQYAIEKGAARDLEKLPYTDGHQYSPVWRGSDGRRQPRLAVAGYSNHADFLDWAAGHGYGAVVLPAGLGTHPLLDFNLNGVVDTTVQGSQSRVEASYFDVDRDGWLSDDERDEDADGLSNWEETHGPITDASWWTSRYPNEPKFRIAYKGTELDDADSDGDGVRDGADDQDHDDIPNLLEMSRNMVSARGYDDPEEITAENANPSPWYGRVQPFNPCLPYPNARTCPRHVPFEGAWAPFGQDDINYLVLN